MIQHFETAAAVSRLPGGDEGVHRFEGVVAEGWDIGGHANGGYLLAIAVRAMAQVAERPPLTITGHYLAPALAGPCIVEVNEIRRGRRMATSSAALYRDGHRTLQVLGTFAEPGTEPVELCDGAPVDLPPYDECVAPAAPDEPPMPALNERLAVRLRPGDDGFRFGRSSGRAEVAGWFAFADGADIDEIALMLVADAFPPPVFNLGGVVGWVPTLELTVHIRAHPVPGPLRCVFRSRFIQGGLIEEDGEIWDGSDRLVAQSRQISLMPRG